MNPDKERRDNGEKREMAVHEKKELSPRRRRPSRAVLRSLRRHLRDRRHLAVVMEMPGREEGHKRRAGKRRLRVNGQIDFSKYQSSSLCIGVNIGHCARAFTLSDKIDRDRIARTRRRRADPRAPESDRPSPARSRIGERKRRGGGPARHSTRSSPEQSARTRCTTFASRI